MNVFKKLLSGSGFYQIRLLNGKFYRSVFTPSTAKTSGESLTHESEDPYIPFGYALITLLAGFIAGYCNRLQAFIFFSFYFISFLFLSGSIYFFLCFPNTQDVRFAFMNMYIFFCEPWIAWDQISCTSVSALCLALFLLLEHNTSESNTSESKTSESNTSEFN